MVSHVSVLAGKGAAVDYEVFCRRCQAEYAVKYEKCTRCSGPVITQAQRREELMAKVRKLLYYMPPSANI